jgi:hypothetical protein
MSVAHGRDAVQPSTDRFKAGRNAQASRPWVLGRRLLEIVVYGSVVGSVES